MLSDSSGVVQVMFVLECTAVNGAHIGELKTSYIVPTLECFHDGALEEGSTSASRYGAVLVHAADRLPASPITTLGPYTCPHQLLQDIDDIEFVGGRCEGHCCLAEGLNMALSCLDELGRPEATRHCIVMCTSPPYGAAMGGVPGYVPHATAELAAKALGERGVNVSIVAPRKIPVFFRLFEHAGGDSTVAQARNFAKDPRHLVLLRGFSLKERPPSPAPPPALTAETQSAVQEQLPMHPNHPAYRQQIPQRPQPPQQFAQAPSYPRAPGMWRMPTQAQRPPYPSNSVLLTQLATPSYPPSSPNMAQQTSQAPPRMPGLGTGSAQAQTAVAPPMSAAGASAGPSAGTPPNPPQAAAQRVYIWSGLLEWVEKGKGGDQQKVTKHLPCQVSSSSKDVEPDLKADKWPNKLLMQLMPKQLICNIGGQYLKDSKSVLFHLQHNEALESLTKVMVSGFAGCVHFTPLSQTPQFDIKVLILLYTADKKAFLGFIPNNQTDFVGRLKKVITQQKNSQISKQVPGSGAGPPLGPSTGQGPPQTLAPGQQMQQVPQQSGMMMGGMAIAGAVGGKGGARPPRPLDDMEAARLEAARLQNLEKIQHLQQTLEAAKQQEAQYRSQMDTMTHPQSAQQQEQFKQLDEQRKQQLQAQLQQLRGGMAPHLAPPAQHLAPPQPHLAPPQTRLMRPLMANNQLRHLLQQQPQYRPTGNPTRPPSQPQQFEDVPNYNDFL